MKPDQSKGHATKMLTRIDSRKNASKRSGLSPVVGKSRDTWKFECARGKERLDSSVKRVLTLGAKTRRTSQGSTSVREFSGLNLSAFNHFR
jgi:hypothetical protein